MNVRMLSLIQQQLTRTKNMISNIDTSGSKLPAILAKECEREIDKLNAMLKDPPTFESRLRERCSRRSHNKKKYISLGQLADTPSNRLYWDLAMLVFKPQTMQEMFGIMLPDINQQLVLTINHAPNDNNAPLPVIWSASPVIKPLAFAREQKPQFDELSHYVMTADTLFDIRQAVGLSQENLALLGKEITAKIPYMHASIVEKYSLKQLSQPVPPRMPTTPREALTNLSHQFKLSTPAVTGKGCNDRAGESVFIGLAAFMDFRDLLTPKQLEALYNLAIDYDEPGVRTLGQFITSHVFRAKQTVDKLSVPIEHLLKRNPSPNSALDCKIDLQSISAEDAAVAIEDPTMLLLAALTNKPGTCVLPALLGEDLFPSFRGQSFLRVSSLLISTPPYFYHEVVKKNASFDMSSYFSLIDEVILNENQVRALISAVVMNYPSRYPELLAWAVTSKQRHAFSAALDNVSAEQCYKYFSGQSSRNNNVLNLLESPQEICLVLDKLTEEHRYSLIIDHQLLGGTPQVKEAILSRITNLSFFMECISRKSNVLGSMDLIARIINNLLKTNPQLARMFAIQAVELCCVLQQKVRLTHLNGDWLREINSLDIIRAAMQRGAQAEDEASFMLSPDQKGNTILHVTNNPEVSTYYLTKIYKKNRFEALTASNKAGVSPLSRPDVPEEIFKSMLVRMPREFRFRAVTARSQTGFSIIYDSVNHEGRLPFILEKLEPERRAAVLLEPYSDNSMNPRALNTTTIMYLVARRNNPKLLRAVLTSLPVKERLRVLLGTYSGLDKQHTINHLRGACLQVAVELLPEQDATELLSCQNSESGRLVASGILEDNKNSSLTIKDFFLSLSIPFLTKIFTAPDNSGRYLLGSFKDQTWEAVPAILARLSQNDRMFIIKKELQTIATKSTGLIKELLGLLNEQQKRIIISRLLQLLVGELDKFKLVLEVMPAEERLQCLQAPLPADRELPAWFSRSSHTLEYMNMTRVAAIIESLPLTHRQAFLLTKTTNGHTVIDDAINSNTWDSRVLDIERCMAALPEEQCLSMLTTKIHNQTLLDAYSELARKRMSGVYNHDGDKKISTWYESMFKAQKIKPNFVMEYMLIYAFLNMEKDKLYQKDSSCSRLFFNNPAGKLLAELKQCQGIDELKVKLIAEMEKPNSAYGAKIAFALGNEIELSKAVASVKSRLRPSGVVVASATRPSADFGL